MERKELVNEIFSFCLVHGLLFDGQTEAITVKNELYYQLQEIDFVEGLIHLLIIKTKNYKSMDISKLKRILLELEKVRLELEYNGTGEEYKRPFTVDSNNTENEEELTAIRR